MIFFLYLMTFSGTIAGQNFDGGWWVWLPVMLAAGVGAWLGLKSNRSGWRMQSTKNDWTSVTFVLYGMLPAMLVLGYDEVHDNQLMILSSMLILAAWRVISHAQYPSLAASPVVGDWILPELGAGGG